MNTTELLTKQLQEAHQWLEATMEGVTDEVAAYQPAGKANPIAGTYAHLVFSEDFFIHTILGGKKTLFETEWEGKTGASEVQPSEWEHAYPAWLRSVKVDVAQMRTYAKAVYKDSEAWVASLTPADLTREVDMSMFGMPNKTVAEVVAGMVIGHAGHIMGEVAVLKGLQDLKGYPF